MSKLRVRRECIGTCDSSTGRWRCWCTTLGVSSSCKSLSFPTPMVQGKRRTSGPWVDNERGCTKPDDLCMFSTRECVSQACQAPLFFFLLLFLVSLPLPMWASCPDLKATAALHADLQPKLDCACFQPRRRHRARPLTSWQDWPIGGQGLAIICAFLHDYLCR